MKRENWFSTPIWFGYTEFDYFSVANKCLELKETNPGRVLSNYGGWQSTDIRLNEYKEFEVVEQIIKQKILDVQQEVCREYYLELNNVWINLNYPGSSNLTHVHPNSALSGTIYICVDENSGKIIFHNKYNFMPIEHYPFNHRDSDLFFSEVSYNPVNGMILIFPAWMPHQVLPNESDITRISISFNIQQIKRD